ncbi:MAG: hypothetical protein AAFP99_12220, partial [Pseudomonadota bacterium]
MKRTLSALAIAAMVAACSSTPSPETQTASASAAAVATGTVITNDSDFRDVVIEKELVNSALTVRFTPGNELIGQRANGEAINGTWLWEEGLFCRTIGEDRNCQVIRVSGNTISFIS